VNCFFSIPKDKFPKGNCIKVTFWKLSYLFKQLDDKLLHNRNPIANPEAKDNAYVKELFNTRQPNLALVYQG